MRTLKETPACDSESPRHRRRKGKHRPFKIEGRYIGERRDDLLSKMMEKYREWHVVGAYETERGQLSAFRAMAQKPDFWHKSHEYRLAATTDG